MKKKIMIFSTLFIFILFLFRITSNAWYMDIGSVNISYLDEKLEPLSYYDEESGEYKTNKFVYGKTGTEYNIESPIIEGYETDTKIVSGIFDGDIKINVIYKKEIKKCNLTINYVDEDKNIIKTSSYVYNYNDNYDILLDDILGYELKENHISGNIKEDTIINVELITIKYKLLIHYVDESNNKLYKDYEAYYKYNESYYVKSPKLKGYSVSNDVIEGNIKEDKEITVKYTANYYKLTVHHYDYYGNLVFNDTYYTLKANKDYYLYVATPFESRYIYININEDTELNLYYKYISYRCCQINYKYYFNNTCKYRYE